MNHDDTDWTVVMLPDIVVGGILARVAFFQFLKLGQDKVVITVQTTHCGWRILKYVYLLSLIILLHLAGILILPPPPLLTVHLNQMDRRIYVLIPFRLGGGTGHWMVNLPN